MQPSRSEQKKEEKINASKSGGFSWLLSSSKSNSGARPDSGKLAALAFGTINMQEAGENLERQRGQTSL